MKKISYIKTIFALFCAAFLFLANSTNPPNGRTGAPNVGGGNEQFCAGCHAGNTNGFDGTIDITGIPATVMGNTTYPVTVTITKTVGNPTRAGFQLTILDDNAITAGSMVASSTGTTVTTTTDREYAEHNNGTMNFGGGNSVSYNFDWTAPSSINGSNITVYSATVMGNSNGNTNGDYSFTHYPTYNFNAGSNPISIATSTTNVLCNGENTGSATATPSGGNGTFSYNWTGGQTNATATNLAAGSYTVTVTSDGVSETETVTITEPSLISISNIQQTNISCSSTMGTATVIASGGTGLLDYEWDNLETGQTASNLTAGNHIVSVTDINSCEETLTVFISSDTTPPDVDAGIGSTITCVNTTLQLDGSQSSAGPNFAYQWVASNGGNILFGDTGVAPTVDATGTYTLTVSNQINGCTATDFVIITEDTNSPTAEAGTGGSINCTSQTVQLDGSGSSIGNNISYQWTANSGSIASDANTLSPTVNAGGTYVLIVTNTDNGCEATDFVTVTEDTTAPIAEAGSGAVLSCVSPTLQLNGSSSSQGDNFSYLWEANNGNIVSGANTLMPTVNAADTYILTVTNTDNGCFSVDFVTITSDSNTPNVAIINTGLLTCNTQGITLDGSGSSQGANFTNLWTASEGGNITGGATTLIPTIDSPGLYTLTITNTNNGCEASESIIIESDTNAPIASTIATEVITCVNQTVLLDGSNSSTGNEFSYNWTASNGGSITGNSTEINAIATSAGTYTLTVTNTDNGCTNTSTVSVFVDLTLPNVDAGSSMALDCNLSSLILNGTNSDSGNGYTFGWTTTDGNIISGANTLTPTVDLAGTYELAIIDNSNGCLSTDVVLVTNNASDIVAVASSSNELNCLQEDVTLNGAGSTEGNEIIYEWTTTDGNITGAIDEITTTANQVGTYCLTVLDTSNGCVSEDCVNIVQAENPTVEISEVENLECNGFPTGFVAVIASGGDENYSYNWSNGGTTASIQQLDAGIYSAVVTDGNFCEITISAVVTEPDALVLNITSTNETAAGANDGTALAGISGGISPYTYNWSNGEESQEITDLEPGNYQVTVLDSNECEVTGEVSISSFDCAFSATASTEDVLCNGDNTGSATITVENETAPVTYAWSSGGNSSVETGLAAGSYTVSINDASNCQVILTVAISEQPALQISISPTDVTCNGGSDGSIALAVSGGVSPYSFNFPNGGDGTNLSAGNYTIPVMDNVGCLITAEVPVTEPSPIITVISSTEESFPGANDGTATVTVEGGVPNYTYLWNDPNNQTTATAINLPAGEYCVIVTDSNACVSDETCIVIINPECPPILATAEITNVTCNGESDGSAIITATGESSPYAIIWEDGGDGTGLDAGTYLVTIISDIDQCQEFLTVTITEPTILTAQTSTTEVSAEGANDGTATVTVEGGTPGYTYLWSDGQTTSTVTNLGAGEHCATITDNNGCTLVTCATVNLTGCTNLIATITTTNVSCNNFNDGSAIANPEGGSGEYTYSWSSGGDTQTETGLSAGTYTVSISDTNDCLIVETFTIEQPTALIVELIEISNIECEGQTSGSATVAGVGGTGNYTYSWSSGGNTETETGLATGNYIVSVNDENNCETTFTIDITAGVDMTPPMALAQNITVNLDDTGNASISANQIDNGSSDNCGLGALTLSQSTFTCDDIGENTITLFVTDINGNAANIDAIVTVSDTIAPEVFCPTIFIVDCDGTVNYDYSAVDNCGNISINFIDGQQSGSQFPVGLTEVSIIAVDASGNSTECLFAVEVQSIFNMTISTTNPSCDGGNDGTVSVETSGGSTPITILVSGGLPNQLPAGTHIVTATDANGCSTSTEITLSDPPALVIDVTQVVDEQNGTGNGAILIDISGGTGNLLPSWSGPNGFTSNEEDLVNLSGGDYVLTLTDENGCEAVSDVINIQNLTAVEEPIWAKNLNVYPNPAFDYLTIEMPTGFSNASFELMNVVGQVVLNNEFSETNAGLRLDVRTLVSGVYWLKIGIEDEFVVRKIFVE